MIRAPLVRPGSQRQALPHSSSSPTPCSPDMIKLPLNSDWLHCWENSSLPRGEGQKVCVWVCVLSLGTDWQTWAPCAGGKGTQEPVKLKDHLRSGWTCLIVCTPQCWIQIGNIMKAPINDTRVKIWKYIRCLICLNSFSFCNTLVDILLLMNMCE